MCPSRPPAPARGVLAEAAQAPIAQALADLVFEVVLHQAETRRLDGIRAFIDRKAEEHRIDPAEAHTPSGNLLVILERGAQDAPERQILSAFMTLGLRASLSRAEPS